MTAQELALVADVPPVDEPLDLDAVVEDLDQELAGIPLGELVDGDELAADLAADLLVEAALERAHWEG